MFNVLFQPAKKPDQNSKEKGTKSGEKRVQFKKTFIKFAQSLTTENKMLAADQFCLLQSKLFLEILAFSNSSIENKCQMFAADQCCLLQAKSFLKILAFSNSSIDNKCQMFAADQCCLL